MQSGDTELQQDCNFFGKKNDWQKRKDEKNSVIRGGMRLQVGVPMALDAPRLARAVGAPPHAADDLAARTAGIRELAPGVTRDQATDALVTALF